MLAAQKFFRLKFWTFRRYVVVDTELISATFPANKNKNAVAYVNDYYIQNSLVDDIFIYWDNS